MCYVLNKRNKRNLYTLYITHILYITRILCTRRILQEYSCVFKDRSPYCRQFPLYSDSQNTIGVNLLGNHSTSCYYVVILLYLHTQPIKESTVVFPIRFRHIIPIYLTVLKSSSTSKKPVFFYFPTILYYPNGANIQYRFQAYLGKDP